MTDRSDNRAAAQHTTPGRPSHTLLASSDAPFLMAIRVGCGLIGSGRDLVGAFGEALTLLRSARPRAAHSSRLSTQLRCSDHCWCLAPPPVPEPTPHAPAAKTAQPKIPIWAFAAGAATLGAAAVAVWFSGVVPSPGDAANSGTETAEAEVAVAEKTAARCIPGPDLSSDARQPSSTDASARRSPAHAGPRVRLTDKSGYFPNTGASPNPVANPATVPPAGVKPSGETIYSSAS